MVIEAMNDAECREMLARTEIVRLACALDNQPYIVAPAAVPVAAHVRVHPWCFGSASSRSTADGHGRMRDVGLS
jgi:nitroimidazol reductase NimA-like FMN-containing flavoprotein (pyridoxamine 5'-phosphate oxidase superfamily)